MQHDKDDVLKIKIFHIGIVLPVLFFYYRRLHLSKNLKNPMDSPRPSQSKFKTHLRIC